MMDRYPIYGGPLHGRKTEKAAIVYADRQVMASLQSGDAEGKTSPRYEYALIDIGDGERAYLPRENADLLAAYQQIGRKAGDTAADVLAGEIERRGLDC